jgi:signal transduction histidine kinase
MAEVATAVLHNVGNVLNSINVSATVIGEKIRGSKLKSVGQLSQLFTTHADKLGPFFSEDPRGKLIPTYLAQLSTHFVSEQEALQAELAAMLGNVEHVKNVINTQQSYARVTGVIERTPPREVIEEALRMDGQAYGRHGITITREVDSDVGVAMIERHKVLQILHNLFINAKQAICEYEPSTRELKVSLAKSEVGFRIRIQDSGVGIKPENRLRIFNHGFTTKKTGHGFGLHASANAAKEMGGSLTVESEGEGHGATFILELPLRPPNREQAAAQTP